MDERTSHDYRKYYNILEIIDNGASGIVFKGKEIKTNEERAIKVIQLDKIKKNMLIFGNEDIEKKLKEYIDGLINEFENMKICYNINSVKCYEYFIDKKNFVIIMELCDGNLSQLLLDKNKKGLNDKEIYEIMIQLNNAFKIMEQNKIIHRDLKLEIFL